MGKSFFTKLNFLLVLTMPFIIWLEKQDIIALLRLLNNFYERLFLCTSRCLEISNVYKNNYSFALEITRKKWLLEFPSIELVLDHLKKRDPCFIPPTNINYDFLYYHLLCSKKETLKETDELGFQINYEDVEKQVIGKNATEYFSSLFDST